MLRLCSGLLAVVVLLGVNPARVHAQAPRARLSSELGGLKWGATLALVQTHVKRQIRKKYQKLLDEADDSLERRKLKGQLEREYQVVLGGYVKFDGQRTGMEVGIAGEEFRHGSGESVLQARESQNDRYYFFIGGKLWKMFNVLPSSAAEGGSFEAFLAPLQQKHGRPTRVQRAKQGAERVPVAAIWRDGRTQLEARDRSEFFQSFTFSVADRRVQQRIEDLRGKPSDARPDSTDALIERATSDRPPEEEGKTKKAPEDPKKAPKAPIVDIY
jgi:hypothetical protein